MSAYHHLIEFSYPCPYCGETIGALLNPDETDSEGYFEYLEDCAVCCSPIIISGCLSLDAEQDQQALYSLTTRRENE